jgi:hypothetical protein
MSWTSSMWTKACLEEWTRSETALVMATAGAESRWRERKVLRTAISTFWSFHGTTWLLRRMTRTVDWAADSRSTGDLAGAVEEEALRDEVGVVVDEGLLDELVEAVEREAEGAAAAGELGEVGGDLAADLRDPGAVLLVEDVLLALGEADVGQGLAERVGDLGQVEALLAVRAEQDDRGSGDGLGARTSRQA